MGLDEGLEGGALCAVGLVGGHGHGVGIGVWVGWRGIGMVLGDADEALAEPITGQGFEDVLVSEEHGELEEAEDDRGVAVAVVDALMVVVIVVGEDEVVDLDGVRVGDWAKWSLGGRVGAKWSFGGCAMDEDVLEPLAAIGVGEPFSVLGDLGGGVSLELGADPLLALLVAGLGGVAELHLDDEEG